jgi:hypothetical protein
VSGRNVDVLNWWMMTAETARAVAMISRRRISQNISFLLFNPLFLFPLFLVF